MRVSSHLHRFGGPEPRRCDAGCGKGSFLVPPVSALVGVYGERCPEKSGLQWVMGIHIRWWIVVSSGGEVPLESPAALCFLEEGVEAVQRKNFHFLLLQFWQGTASGGIHGDNPLLDCAVAGGGDHLVDIAHSLNAETFGLAAGFDAVHTA